MVDDARFEDARKGGDRGLRLQALDPDDLQVISSLVQDAVFPITEMKWQRSKRRFSLLLNRFRWEDEVEGQPPERVQSVLAFDDVGAVRSQGVDRSDTGTILSLLAIDWASGEDGSGRVTLVLAGFGEIELAVEALTVTLQDVTRPYRAPSGQRPGHPED